MSTEPRTLHEVMLHEDLRILARRETPADLAWITRYLLEHGRYWEPAPRPKGVRRRRGKDYKANAQRALIDAHTDRPRDVVYVEGIALRGLEKGQVRHHAWLADPDGRVIEVTHPAPALAYFGVSFPWEHVSAVILREPYFRSLLAILADEAGVSGEGVTP
jgi:hypothetical protein